MQSSAGTPAVAGPACNSDVSCFAGALLRKGWARGYASPPLQAAFEEYVADAAVASDAITGLVSLAIGVVVLASAVLSVSCTAAQLLLQYDVPTRVGGASSCLHDRVRAARDLLVMSGPL
jgi:hypothetical protein